MSPERVMAGGQSFVPVSRRQSFVLARVEPGLVQVRTDRGFVLLRAKPGFVVVGTLRAASWDQALRQPSGMR